jgi:hypothetical protein
MNISGLLKKHERLLTLRGGATSVPLVGVRRLSDIQSVARGDAATAFWVVTHT